MKKITLLSFGLLMISVVALSQDRMVIKLPAEMQISSTEKSGWVGHSDMVSLTIIDAGYEYAMRIMAGDQTPGDQITHVKFYSDHENYTGYGATNTSYSIVIYEGGSFDEANGYDAITACGTSVYTQSYTATTSGPQEVELTTPYTIGTGEFWVAIHCDGTSILGLGNADEGTLNHYVSMFNSGGTDYWVNNSFCNNPPDCTEFVTKPFFLSVFVDDGGTYVENSDLGVSGYLDNMTDQNWITTLELEANDSLKINPVFANSGPDNATELITVTINADEMELGSFDIDPANLTGGNFPAGASSVFPLGLMSATDMNMAGLSSFDLCISLSYAGVDNNAANDEACLSVTRNLTAVSTNLTENISIYPNPSTGIVTIDNAQGETIEILNILGEEVFALSNASDNQKIDLSDLPCGNYFIRINSELHQINIIE